MTTSAQDSLVIKGVELVRIPGGKFLMGSLDDEDGRYSDEGPQHDVELNSFYLAKTPVTNAQYGRFLKANPKTEKPENWGGHQADHPAVGVSWYEAMSYCAWAGLTLPTEAQWEYACRAGTTTRYSSGDREADLSQVGWYDYAGIQLHHVGQKEPNAWGLYDMHGSVREWCRDWWCSYHDSPRAGDGLRIAPYGNGLRAIRGGGWVDQARDVRSAFRNWGEPDLRYSLIGFRCAKPSNESLD